MCKIKVKMVRLGMCFLTVIVFASRMTVFAQNAPTSDQFKAALHACAAGQSATVGAEMIDSVVSLYATQGAQGFVNSKTFLSLIPDDLRFEGYRLYVDCITKILADTTVVPPPITVTYRVCSGEYERSCHPHDVYLYCYEDVVAWAKARCASATVQRLSSYGGNKCGYSIDAIICTGPK
jgi:hypothetical protein